MSGRQDDGRKVEKMRSKYFHYLLTYSWMVRAWAWVLLLFRARFPERNVFLVLCARAKHQRHIIESIFLMTPSPVAPSRRKVLHTPAPFPPTSPTLQLPSDSDSQFFGFDFGYGIGIGISFGFGFGIFRQRQ